MKKLKIFSLMLGMLILIIPHAIATDVMGRATLYGRITDAKTGESLPGVNVYIPDLQVGTVSDVNGDYRLENIPEAKMMVQLSFVGYQTLAESIHLTPDTRRDFALSPSAREITEIVITGLSQATARNRTPTPIAVVSKTELLQTAATNAIDAIAQQPGVSEVTTGAAISKPVIRGLGYNRVVVVNDGVRQEGQQWGDEHGIEIDPYSINHVEILKGPASLVYGSDAMAGVINMIAAPSLPVGKMAGSVLFNYQTNNGLYGVSADMQGNKKGLIWDLRLSGREAHAYQDRYDGYVFNSGFKENAVSGMVGLNRDWGYSHLHFSMYNLTPGIVEGERDSLTGNFVKAIMLPNGTEGVAIATHSDMMSYSPKTPYQKIHHYKLVLDNTILLNQGYLKTIFGFQQNQRQEYADILKPNAYGLYFLLNTLSYDVRYVFPDWKGINFSTGVNGMEQTSQNKGSEFLVPAYNLFDIGGFVMAKRTFGKLDLSAGIRYDRRQEHGSSLYLDANEAPTSSTDPTATLRFPSFNSVFTGTSGSVGAAYQLPGGLYTKLNLSRGYRAPNIAELGSNGVHEGTFRYEVGNPDLKPESSMQFDYSLGYNSEHVSTELNLFTNNVNNYIFLRKETLPNGADLLTDGVSTFKYVSGDANLKGGEFTIDVHPHPLDWIHFQNSFSYVEGVLRNQPDSSRNLPFMPPARWQSELRFNAKKVGGVLQNAYVSFGVDMFFAQNKIYSAFNTETASPRYTLMNLGLGTDFVHNSKTICSLYVTVNNLADVAYQSHLSRLQYAPVNNVTGRTGVYDMGRNIDFKLIFPLNF